MRNPIPDDLRIEAVGGSLVPGEENQVVEIGVAGSARYARYEPATPGPPLEEVAFVVAKEQLETLWTLIQQTDFFSLQERYAAEEIEDGAFASLTITARGRTHRVEVVNTSVPRFEELLRTINHITPEGKDLLYEGPRPEE